MEPDPLSRPRRRRAAGATPGPALTSAERALLRAPCRYHAGGAVCSRCPGVTLDSTGFPTAVAEWRLRMRYCPRCGLRYAIPEWSFEHDACRPCSEGEGER